MINLSSETLNKLSNGSVADLNEFLNFKAEHKSKLDVSKNMEKHEKKVVSALFSHRLKGGSFEDTCGIRYVAEKLGLSSRLVNRIYKENKDWIKPLKNKEQNKVIGYGSGQLPTLLEFAKIKRSTPNK